MIDTKKNTKIVYLYINEFKWMLSEDNEMAMGHPKEKTLYRGVYNTDTGTYRGIYETNGKMKGFFLKKLISKENISEEDITGYTSNIIEVSPSTILDCNLTEKELDKLTQWIQSENKDLMEELWPREKTGEIKAFRIPDEAGEAFTKVFADMLRGTPSELSQLTDSLGNIRDTDPLMFEAIEDLIYFLGEEEGSTQDSILDPTWINSDKLHGTGANMSAALTKLARYCGHNRRVNLDKADLFGAMKNLLNEQIRRNINGEE